MFSGSPFLLISAHYYRPWHQSILEYPLLFCYYLILNSLWCTVICHCNECDVTWQCSTLVCINTRDHGIEVIENRFLRPLNGQMPLLWSSHWLMLKLDYLYQGGMLNSWWGIEGQPTQLSGHHPEQCWVQSSHSHMSRNSLKSAEKKQSYNNIKAFIDWLHAVDDVKQRCGVGVGGQWTLSSLYHFCISMFGCYR